MALDEETKGEDEETPVSSLPEIENEVCSTYFPYCIDSDQRLSKSVIWKQMTNFYDKNGVDAWSNGVVPCFITCNAFIAKSYAITIHGYIRDLLSKGKLFQEEPLYIVEVGAGCGKFSFLLLKALLKRSNLLYGNTGNSLNGKIETETPFRIKYVMTDFTASNFNFWRKHPALQSFIKAGVLDFAKFDATKDESISLYISKTKISPNKPLQNPMIVVANYLFDSLPADAFCVKDSGSLFEGRVSIYSSQRESDNTDPDILGRFKARFDWKDLPDEELLSYYSCYGERVHKVIVEILQWYREHFKNREASFLIPIESICCIDRLSKLSSSFLLLSGDKGNSKTDAFVGLSDPHIAVHGSFSLMVNYHAIGLWFDSLQGFAMHCPLDTVDLKVSAFLLPNTTFSLDESLETMSKHHWNSFGSCLPSRMNSYFDLKLSFHDSIAQFGPNSFFTLQRVIEKRFSDHSGAEYFDLDSIIGMIRLSNWDPDLYYKFREDILDRVIEPQNHSLLADISRDVQSVWENYYHLEQDRDISYEIGRFYYGIQYYEKSLAFYVKSTQLHGTHHITEYNKALCHTGLGDTESALRCLACSTQLDPTYPKALELQNRLLASQEQEERSQISSTITKKLAGKRHREHHSTHSPNMTLRNKATLTHRVTIDPEVLTRKVQNNSAR